METLNTSPLELVSNIEVFALLHSKLQSSVIPQKGLSFEDKKERQQQIAFDKSVMRYLGKGEGVKASIVVSETRASQTSQSSSTLPNSEVQPPISPRSMNETSFAPSSYSSSSAAAAANQQTQLIDVFDELVDLLKASRPPSALTNPKESTLPPPTFTKSKKDVKFGYGLSDPEVLQILNLLPTDMSLLFLCIQECDERFSQLEIDELLRILKEIRGDEEGGEEGEGEEEEGDDMEVQYVI